MYEFYSTGFFGYGESGDFRYFSIAHFVPIILLIIAIFATYKYQEKLRNWKYEERARYIYAFIMMIVEMSYFWRLLYVGDEITHSSLMLKLPLQVCQWSLITSIFMVMTKNQKLFNICFYVCLVFGTAALITPTVIVMAGPRYYRYYQFFLEHEMPIFAVFYMAIIHKLKPEYKGMYEAAGCMLLLAAICIYANNRIEGANYMYLAGYSDGAVAGNNIINYLPKGQYVRLLILALIGITLFHIIYFLWKTISTKLKKS
jgi:hypothetical integral membrane protein (TIGR02206 family)